MKIVFMQRFIVKLSKNVIFVLYATFFLTYMQQLVKF